MSLATILQATVGGLLLGGIYALLSAGLTLIFGVMRVINFAQAEFMMVGMFATYVLATSSGIDPLILALPIGCGLALLGWLMAAGLLERVPRGDHNAQLILTLGVSLVLQNLALIVFGPTPRPRGPSLHQLILDAGRSFHQRSTAVRVPRFRAAHGRTLFLSDPHLDRAGDARHGRRSGLGRRCRHERAAIARDRFHDRRRARRHCRRLDGDIHGGIAIDRQ